MSSQQKLEQWAVQDNLSEDQRSHQRSGQLANRRGSCRRYAGCKQQQQDNQRNHTGEQAACHISTKMMLGQYDRLELSKNKLL